MSTSIEVSTLPRLSAWAAMDPAITPLGWLHAESDIETAVAFTALFWPELVEHDGGIFLREFFDPEVYEDWKRKLGSDTAAIERVMNHRHIADLLPGADGVGFKNLQHLGEVLAATWRARLASAFPQRPFDVTCHADAGDEEVVIAFCQSLPDVRQPSSRALRTP